MFLRKQNTGEFALIKGIEVLYQTPQSVGKS